MITTSIQKIFFIVLFFTACNIKAQSYNKFQTIRGNIIDKVSLSKIPNATVFLSNKKNSYTTTSNAEGYFQIDSVIIDEYNIEIKELSYLPVFLQNQSIQSGKEFYIDIELKSKVIILDEVIVLYEENTSKLTTSNKYRIDIANLHNYSGNRNDPSNLLKNLPSVTGVDDNRGLISVRGMAPWGIAYKIENTNVLPPLHFSNLGIIGSHVTMLNGNYMKNYDFNIGSFDSRLGNALGGIVDVELQNGNNKKFQCVFGSTWNGFELGLEGPFSKKSNASYFISYRYSFLAAMARIFNADLTKAIVPFYQDVTFKINIPTLKFGKFSFWGIGGPSSYKIKDTTSSPTIFNIKNSSTLNLDYLTILFGMNHFYKFSENSYGKFSISNSIYTYQGINTINFQNNFSSERLNFNYKINLLNINYDFSLKINSKNDLRFGTSVDYYDFKLDAYIKPFLNTYITPAITYNFDTKIKYLEGAKSTYLLKEYTNYRHYFTDDFSINTGVYYQTFLLNNSYNIEPRLSMEYDLNQHNFSLNSGLHSQIQPLDYYFTKDNGLNVAERIKNLGMNKSFQSGLNYKYIINDKLNVSLSTYYHYHYNIATDDSIKSHSVLNAGSNYFFNQYSRLSNSGLGQTYGLEMMIEQKKIKGFYGFLSASYFDSQYTGSDKIWRNSFFNLQKKVTFFMGKEFKWQTDDLVDYIFFIDTKINYAGGNWITPINVAATKANPSIIAYQDDKANSIQLPDYFRWDCRIGYKIIGEKTTMVFSIDCWNLTRNKNVFNKNINPYNGEESFVYQNDNLLPVFFFQVMF